MLGVLAVLLMIIGLLLGTVLNLSVESEILGYCMWLEGFVLWVYYNRKKG